MIKIRRNVFETNSSSTHSITIEDDYDNYERTFQYVKIPHNTDIYIDEPAEYNADGNNLTEWQKLNALIDFIIGYYDPNDDDDNGDTDKPLFSIIKNVIKDKCNSVLNIDLMRDHYAIYDDTYGNTLDILDLSEDSTEEEIYNRFKEIIFNPKVNFKHKENEY
jgi:hypothetical protein